MTVDATAIEVGDSRTMVVAQDLPRTQIVMYAGASGDYNPLHSDEIYTTEIAGYPSVFAHGMLSMGASGRVLTDWFGPSALKRYSCRFVNQVWPGDTLTCTATVTEIRETDDGTVADLEVVTVNQDDKPVVNGAATVALG